MDAKWYKGSVFNHMKLPEFASSFIDLFILLLNYVFILGSHLLLIALQPVTTSKIA